MKRSVLLLFLALCTPIRADREALPYLKAYGYLADSNISLISEDDALQTGIILFQDNYGLEPTGKLDEATKELLFRPRCGNKDHLSGSELTKDMKWTVRNLKWYSYDPNIPLGIAEKAFALWEKHINMTFTRSRDNPQILIAFKKTRNHSKLVDANVMCPYEFGEGTLAHASYPVSNTSEIHINSEDHIWLSNMSVPSENDVHSLFYVLVHEIGHTLGIFHSTNNKTVMFPSSPKYEDIPDMNKFELHPDDIIQAQMLYGEKPKIPVTTTTTPAPIEELSTGMDICNYKYNIQQVLVLKHYVFFFYNNLMWRIPLNPATRIRTDIMTPYRITSWLTFLPRTMFGINTVYETREGNMVLFINETSYTITFPGMKLIKQTPIKDMVKYLSLESVTGSYMDYRGNRMLIADRQYVLEVESPDQATLRRHASTFFPGISFNSLYSVFKNKNGKLYFLNRPPNSSITLNIYEFDEYTDSVTGTYDNVLELFEIICEEETILKSLYELVTKLAKFKRIA